MAIKTIEWIDNHIRMIDQTRLPEKLIYLDIKDIPTLCEAIQNLRIRGAPAIGIAAAMGVALSAINDRSNDKESFIKGIQKSIGDLQSTRPTAVNLFWALERMQRVLNLHKAKKIQTIQNLLVREGRTIWKEDRQICHQIGGNGATLLPDHVTVLTHCNAGGLATSEYGSALGVIYKAHELGKKVTVYADETRPLLQGARLTTWELQNAGIDVTLICDSSAGFLMQQGKIDCVIIGADRIASNGDVANKIGTYTLAVLAKKHNIPFYVAAPISTIDFNIDSGTDIPIEQRSSEEVTEGFGKRIAPENIDVYNPAFDVTPKQLITAIITEKGVFTPPFKPALSKLSQD
jgi:methylthioribose-1-phosphate isomerase